MRFTFKHLTGSRAGQEQAVEGRVVNVGRNETNLIAFDPEKDDRVSGNHAQLLVMDDGRVLLSDLGSRNGTFVGPQKVAGPTPIPSGTIVQFGSEGGPTVMVTYGEAPAPTAASVPTPATGGGSGCLICGVLGLLLGLCVVVGVAVLAFRARVGAEGDERERALAQMQAEEDAARDRAGTPATPATPAPAPEPAPAPAPPPVVVDRRTPWGRCGVGTSFGVKSSSTIKMQGMADMKSDMTMTYTVTAATDTTVHVKTEMVMANVPPQVTEQDYPARVTEGDPTGEKPTFLEERSESVTVPAGTFTCTYRKMKQTAGGVESTVETWMADDMPVPYKCVVVSPTSNTVQELASMEKKP